MKYIYDIILNFNESLYEFYEWKDDDNIEYIKKISIVKVTESVFSDLKNNEFVVENEFLNSIYNKCEVYGNYGIGRIEYACLFCIDDSIIAFEFNDKGKSIYRSDLYLDECIDVLNYVKKLKVIDFKYKILSNYDENLITRKEIDMINFIKKEINLIYENENIDKLKYIYYECFNRIDENVSKMILDLEKYILEYPSKLFDLLMLSYSKGLQK